MEEVTESSFFLNEQRIHTKKGINDNGTKITFSEKLAKEHLQVIKTPITRKEKLWTTYEYYNNGLYQFIIKILTIDNHKCWSI
jgi:hypothetical protein